MNFLWRDYLKNCSTDVGRSCDSVLFLPLVLRVYESDVYAICRCLLQENLQGNNFLQDLKEALFVCLRTEPENRNGAPNFHVLQLTAR